MARPSEPKMPRPYTRISLEDVEDAAPANGFGARWEARVARTALDAEQTGVTHFRLRPGKRSPFTHRHARAEEIYVILRGRGHVKLDDQLTKCDRSTRFAWRRRSRAHSRRAPTDSNSLRSDPTTTPTANRSTTRGLNRSSSYLRSRMRFRL